jgi:Secretion system C-terminal sorting domain/PKD domain/SprB repeat
MKSLLSLIFVLLATLSLQAQCNADYSYTADTTGNVVFTDLSNAGPSFITSWFWDFGDGTSSSLQNPTHFFNNGTYLVCLSITTADSCYSSSCDTIVIGNGINPCFGFAMTHQVSPVTTMGGSNGSITTNVTGGTQPYIYAWGHGPSTANLTNLSVGSYNVTVTDSMNCVIYNQMYVWEDSIINPNPCQISITGVVTDASAIGASNGAIDITVSNATAPIIYSWNNSATTEDISNLTKGTYSVWLVDADTCTASASFFVDEPGTPNPYDTLFASAVDTCINFVWDSVYVQSYVQTGPNTVLVTWVFTGAGQTAIVEVEYQVPQSGNYYIVLDVNCVTKTLYTFIDSYFIDLTASITENTNIEELNIYPNPVNNILNIDLKMNKSENITIKVFNTLGQTLISDKQTVQDGATSLSYNTESLESGIYFISIISESNEIKTLKFIK